LLAFVACALKLDLASAVSQREPDVETCAESEKVAHIRGCVFSCATSHFPPACFVRAFVGSAPNSSALDGAEITIQEPMSSSDQLTA
jgi:hypothetical protein